MVDGKEPELIQVRGLPQLFRYLNGVSAVLWLQRFTWNAHVLERSARGGVRHRYPCPAPRPPSLIALPHDSYRHPERALPHDVGDEPVLPAVPGIQESAGALELLQLEHIGVGPGEINRLRHTVGPLHAQHVGFQVRAEPDLRQPVGYDACLIELTRA